MKLGARSLLNALDKALRADGEHVSVRRVDAEDLRAFMKSAAKQDDGEGVLVLLRLRPGVFVEPDGSEREPSRLFIPTDAHRHTIPEITAAFDARMSEQQTINVLCDALRDSRRQALRMAELFVAPVVIPVGQFDGSNKT